MKLFRGAADGGETSGVKGYFLIECKSLFSVVLLHFNPGTREAYHSHAFNAVTLWLRGRVREHHYGGGSRDFRRGQLKVTRRATTHKVESLGHAWALSFRGPWADRWQEFRQGRLVTLTHGRKVVA